jgi:Xaa-Pro aminopeptidase
LHYFVAYIIPSDDPHLSEYVPAAYMRRGYLTDFHGSAGTALVLSDQAASVAKDIDGGDERGAYLWTDSR